MLKICPFNAKKKHYLLPFYVNLLISIDKQYKLKEEKKQQHSQIILNQSVHLIFYLSNLFNISFVKINHSNYSIWIWCQSDSNKPFRIERSNISTEAAPPKFMHYICENALVIVIFLCPKTLWLMNVKIGVKSEFGIRVLAIQNFLWTKNHSARKIVAEPKKKSPIKMSMSALSFLQNAQNTAQSKYTLNRKITDKKWKSHAFKKQFNNVNK